MFVTFGFSAKGTETNLTDMFHVDGSNRKDRNNAKMTHEVPRIPRIVLPPTPRYPTSHLNGMCLSLIVPPLCFPSDCRLMREQSGDSKEGSTDSGGSTRGPTGASTPVKMYLVPRFSNVSL